MKALVIDSSAMALTVAAKNDDKICTTQYDIGMKQSQTLVPAIDYVLKETGLTSSELDYTALCIGPGSFTGLRLAISALKAIELAYNVPVYGISTLETYAYPYKSYGLPVLSALDANKDKFYARISKDNKEILKADDYELDVIVKNISALDKVILAGFDAQKLADALKEKAVKTELIVPKFMSMPSFSLFEIAEIRIQKKEPPLQDYDGPLYLRASEAELKLNEKL